MTRRLIVNADDLGRSRGINDGIFEAHARGVVSSATLMVGFEAAVDAAERLARHPALGVGLHVTLTGSRPTLPVAEVPSLVDAAGRLPRKPEQIDGFRPEEILAEVRHQLLRFRELTGRLPTHLDSHHHSHRDPAVLEALIAVASESDLPVRRSSEAIAARLAAAGVATTTAFSERFFGPDATVDRFLEILDEAPEGTLEIMCHPGYPDERLRAESGYADERRAEIDVLTDPEVRDAVRARFVLGTFGDGCAR
ncbi:MAG: carbohydrate deacetylase [Thermoanaerobaculia bacterium]